MLMHEFCQGRFVPRTEEQRNLLDAFLKQRSHFGEPSRFSILRRLAKTRPFTRSIYPPDWHVA